MYAVGSGSIAYFLTANAANACASVIKYVFSELSSELNKIASAIGDTPVTFPGNNITGTLIIGFISATSLASSNWSMADDPQQGSQKLPFPLLFLQLMLHLSRPQNQ